MKSGNARLGAGSECAQCALESICSANNGNDACGTVDERTSYGWPRPRLDIKEYSLQTAPWRPIPPLPSVLPIVDRFDGHAGPVALRGRSVGNAERWRILGMELRAASLLGSDRDLHRMPERHTRLAIALARWGADVVIAPGYSTWQDFTPDTNLLHMALSARAYVDLVQHLPTIPTVVWRYPADLGRWLTWLLDIDAEAFCVDCGQRDEEHWQATCQSLDWLYGELQAAGRDPRLVLRGKETLPRLKAARAIWPGPFTLLTRGASVAASAGKVAGPSLRYEVRDDLTRRGCLGQTLKSLGSAVDADAGINHRIAQQVTRGTAT